MSEWRGTFPDLPILEELGAQLETAAQHERGADVDVPSGAPPQRSRRWPGPWVRPALRLALGALAVSAVAGAILVGALGPSSQPDSPPPIDGGDAGALAQGRGPDDAWKLTLEQAAEGRCLTLAVAGAAPARACLDDPRADRAPDAPPVAASQAPVRLLSVTNGPRDGFVFGTVIPTVAQVRVMVAGREVTADARTLSKPSAGKTLKAFVAAFDQPVDPATPVEAVALDQRGGVIARVSRPPGG